MLCNECNKNEAQVTYLTIENNEVKEVHICHECIQKFLGEEFYVSIFKDPNLNNFMEQIFSLFLNEEDREKVTDIRCPECNHSLAEFNKTTLLGCSHCYESFQKELEKIVEHLHGTIYHEGHRPAYMGPVKAKEEEISPKTEIEEEKKPKEEVSLEELKKRLALAIEEERYEDAAILRDEIKGRESEEHE